MSARPEKYPTHRPEGASHASFGDYGPQDGDGRASISDEEVDAQVSAEVEEFVGSVG